MSCRLPLRKALDGTLVLIVIPDDVEKDPLYFVASNMQPWTGDPATLTRCITGINVSQDCTFDAQTLVADPTPTAASGPQALSLRELDRWQDGRDVYDNGNTITNPSSSGSVVLADYPQTVDIPAHTPGCLIAVHITHGSFNVQTDETQIADVDVTWGGGSTSNPTVAWKLAPDTDIPSVGATVYLLETSDGSADTLTIQPQFSAGSRPIIYGAVQVVISEICDPAPTNLQVSDLLTASAVLSQSTPDESQVGEADPTGEPSDPLNMGDCPALIWASARHVNHDPAAGNSSSGEDVDWFSTSIADVEAYDITSNNSANSCQLGSALTYIPPGSGDFTWTFTPNQVSLLDDGVTFWSTASAAAIPVNCTGASAGGDPTVVGGENCQLSIENTIPEPATLTVTGTLTGTVEIVSNALTATIEVLNNGTVIPGATFTTTGADGDVVNVNLPVSFTQAVSGGATVTADLTVRVTNGIASIASWVATGNLVTD